MDGVLFGDKHSYRDWGLVLKSRPSISPPSAKTVYVDIPGSDGNIDLTETLTGHVEYNNRTITCEFWVLDAKEKWSDIYSEIMDYLQGHRMKVVLDEDPAYYYVGRLHVNEWKSDIKVSTITIEGNIEPYKLEAFSSLEDWEWDSFNFETGIIREYKELRVDGELNIVIMGRKKTVVPEFRVVSDDETGIQVQFGGYTYELKDGTTTVLNIVIEEGENTLLFTGNGTVSIDYRGGRL